MKRLLSVIALVLVAATTRADVADVAELFPESTLAYAEIAHPAALSDEATKLFAKSAFADSVKAAHDRFDKLALPQDAAAVQRAALMALLLSPEMLSEVRKFHGIAFGLTGFDARGGPRYALAILLGDSTAAGLAAKAYLTASPNLRRVGSADGTPIFQRAGFSGPLNGEDGKPVVRDDAPALSPLPAEGVPTFAYRPGLVVLGSDAACVADVMRRSYGTEKSKSLAADESFRRARPAEKFSGAFAYCVSKAIAQKVDAVAKASGKSPTPEWFQFASAAVPLNATTAWSGTLTVKADAIRFVADLGFDPATPNAIRDAFSGPNAPALSGTILEPKRGWESSLALPVKEKRSKAVLDLADAIARGQGVLGRKPSEIVADSNRGTGPKIADLLAGVRTVHLHRVMNQKVPSLPFVAFECESAAVAEAWIERTPHLVAMLGGLEMPPTRSSERIGAFTVFSVPGSESLGMSAIHFASSADRFVFGADRAAVVELLTAREPTTESDAPFAARIRPSSFFPESKPVVKKNIPIPVPNGLQPQDLPPELNPPRPAEPLEVGLAQAFLGVPAIPVTVAPTPAGIHLKAVLANPAQTVCGAVDRFLDWLAKQPVAAERPGQMYLPQ